MSQNMTSRHTNLPQCGKRRINTAGNYDSRNMYKNFDDNCNKTGSFLHDLMLPEISRYVN